MHFVTRVLKSAQSYIPHGKNGFVTATKLGTTIIFFVAAAKFLLQQKFCCSNQTFC